MADPRPKGEADENGQMRQAARTSQLAGQRILGLSPRARRVVLWLLVVAAVAVPVSYGVGRAAGRTAPPGGALALLGPDLDHILVGGEWGGSRFDDTRDGWRPITALTGKDVMAWATTSDQILAGTHQGLYVSTDHGQTFASAEAPFGDVHAVGAASQTRYAISPDGSVWVSKDGGARFERAGRTPASVMGTIWVDPNDPDIAIAPSPEAGALRTTDGGATWLKVGGPSEALSVAANRHGNTLLVLGSHGAQISRDGGGSWSPIALPPGTKTVAYDETGAPVVAGWGDDQVDVMRHNGTSWVSLGSASTR